MDWLFNPEYRKVLTYPEARRLLESDVVSPVDLFGDSPFLLWWKHYDTLFENVRARQGLKLRVPVTTIGQLTQMTRTLVSMADLVVFRPHPNGPAVIST